MNSTKINSIHFMGLLSHLESPEFVSMEITSDAEKLPAVLVEPLHGEDAGKVFRLYQPTGKAAAVTGAPEIVAALSDYFNRGYNLAACRTKQESILYTRTPGGVKIKSEPAAQTAPDGGEMRFEVKDLLASEKIRRMLVELSVLTKEGEIRREQYNKLIQIKNLLSVVYDVLPQFRGRQYLNIVDGACGKSYLSFVLYHFLREEWGFDARFQCIDTNTRLISRCEQIQETLSYREMKFFVNTIGGFKSGADVDMLYSLHGCDTASDEAIAAGVELGSRVIIVVPCCHFELRSQLRRHPLKALTKFGLFEERFAALLTDALRALALEAAGYDVSIFRFVTDDISPKNTLIRAVKRETPKQQALQQYHELRAMFGVSPAVEKLLPALLSKG